MSIKDVIEKLLSGEELSESEKDFAKNYDVGVPKRRLDEEISKKKALEEELAKVKTDYDEIASKAKEIEDKGLSEQEKIAKAFEDKMTELNSKVESLEQAKLEAEKSLQEQTFSSKVKDIASNNKFVDSDYLTFMIKSKEIDINDETTLTSFIEETKKSNPALFIVENQAGSGASGNAVEPQQDKDVYNEAKKSGDIELMLINAPTIE